MTDKQFKRAAKAFLKDTSEKTPKKGYVKAFACKPKLATNMYGDNDALYELAYLADAMIDFEKDNLADKFNNFKEKNSAGANVAAEENNVVDPFDGFREEI